MTPLFVFLFVTTLTLTLHFTCISQKTEDLKTFTTYCDKPYDRHHYVINFKDGKTITVDEYELPECYGISPKMK